MDALIVGEVIVICGAFKINWLFFILALEMLILTWVWVLGSFKSMVGSSMVPSIRQSVMRALRSKLLMLLHLAETVGIKKLLVSLLPEILLMRAWILVKSSCLVS